MHIVGKSRTQMQLGYSLENEIESDNEVRVIDAFIDTVDMVKCGFKQMKDAKEGRPGYAPQDLCKLYVYGNLNCIRSSRRLARECCRNIEVKWLLNELRPDFRTISDFRKDNSEALVNLFREFNRFIRGKANSELYSVDGSKFRASNSRTRVFTACELDERIARLSIKLEDYLHLLDQNDQTENDIEPGTSDFKSMTKEEILAKIEKTKEKLEQYQQYLNTLHDSGQTQLSLTDPDARIMRTGNGYCVGYNVQTAVDSDHNIADFLVSTSSTDHGLLDPTLAGTRLNHNDGIINATADKGYEKPEDIVACLQNGIIPNVIPPEGKTSYKLETEYISSPISEQMRTSTQPVDIKKMLQSGTIPDALKNVLTDIKVVEKKERIIDDSEYDPKMSIQEYLAEAAKGYFLRDIQEDKVYCPGGQILRRISTRPDNSATYQNKRACEKCPFHDKCTKEKFRRVRFKPRQCRVELREWDTKTTYKTSNASHVTIKKVVSFVFTPIQSYMKQRKCLSEHPFGTIKRAFNGSYFLTRGKRKVAAETALLCLAYNIRHAIKRIGVPELLKAVRAFARMRFLLLFWGLFFDFIHPRKAVMPTYRMVGRLLSDARKDISKKSYFLSLAA